MTNLTTTHPATALWWEQRGKCRACANLIEREGLKGSLGMRCAAVVWADIVKLPGYEAHPDLRKYKHTKKINHRGGFAKADHYVYCIDARMDGAPCGPDANLFKEKQHD